MTTDPDKVARGIVTDICPSVWSSVAHIPDWVHAELDAHEKTRTTRAIASALRTAVAEAYEDAAVFIERSAEFEHYMAVAARKRADLSGSARFAAARDLADALAQGIRFKAGRSALQPPATGESE